MGLHEFSEALYHDKLPAPNKHIQFIDFLNYNNDLAEAIKPFASIVFFAGSFPSLPS